MRAAFLKTEGRLVMIDAQMPTIQSPDQILIKVRTVGVCGSEVHAFQGSHPFRKAPVILGHEMAGDVVSVGESVVNFKTGDRVIVDPQWACGECAYCRTGDINLCPSKKMLGTSVWPGAFGEYITAPEKSVLRLPDSLSYTQGSLIEPLSVAVHVARRANVSAHKSVAILGTGSVGSMLVGVCHAYGAKPVVAVDIHQHCLDIACKRMGATHGLLAPDEKLADRVNDLTNGEGVDVAFVTADEPTLVTQGMEMAKRRGRIMLVALLTGSPLRLTAYEILRKELEIVGNMSTNHENVQRAIALAVSGQVDVNAVATHVLPIEEAQRGMELASTKDDNAIKVILSFGAT
jgi:L-iditol 2-dehydrogenase